MSDGRDDDSSRECAGTREAGACRNARRPGGASGGQKGVVFGRFGGALGALLVGFSDPRFAQAPAGPGVVENAVPAQLFSLGESARPRAGGGWDGRRIPKNSRPGDGPALLQSLRRETNPNEAIAAGAKTLAASGQRGFAARVDIRQRRNEPNAARFGA